jgi:hypothetical protein
MIQTTQARWLIIVLFAGLSALAFFAYSGDADKLADGIDRRFEANEELSESAPQQQVAATWSVLEAEVVQVRQNGIRNGLLGVAAAMLTSIAVNVALSQRLQEKAATPKSTEV